VFLRAERGVFTESRTIGLASVSLYFPTRRILGEPMVHICHVVDTCSFLLNFGGAVLRFRSLWLLPPIA